MGPELVPTGAIDCCTLGSLAPRALVADDKVPAPSAAQPNSVRNM